MYKWERESARAAAAGTFIYDSDDTGSLSRRAAKVAKV
jgi:hypothetical protein